MGFQVKQIWVPVLVPLLMTLGKLLKLTIYNTQVCGGDWQSSNLLMLFLVHSRYRIKGTASLNNERLHERVTDI